MKSYPMGYMNLNEDVKPLKKVNTGVNTQSERKNNSLISKNTKSRANLRQRENSRGIYESRQSSNRYSDTDSYHYLVEEADNQSNEEYNKPFIEVLAWNINGMRAMAKKKDLKELIRSKDPDIVCFYELRCDKYSYIAKNVRNDFNFMEIYPYKYFNFSQITGYAGVAVYSKIKPKSYSFHINHHEIDIESRFIQLEFNSFNFISVYVPTSGDNLKRLDYRIDIWDATFHSHVAKLLKHKPVVIAGDMNVAHKEVDIHNPKVS